MNNLIEQLKKNKYPFGLMSQEMQAEAKDISIVKFDYYNGQNEGDWDVDSKDDFFRHYRTYRLRSDYADEPEIVECEITEMDGHLRFRYDGISSHSIHQACDHAGFIGFKFADGSWHDKSIKAVNAAGEVVFEPIFVADIISGAVRILHATHVLFRQKKQE